MRMWWLLVLAGCSFQAGSPATGDGGGTSTGGAHDARKTGSDAAIQPASVVDEAFGSGASLRATLNGSSHVGDVVLVVVYGQGTISGVSDTAGGNYASLATASAAGDVCGLYSARVMEVTTSNTVTATVGGAGPLLVVAEYSNVPQGNGALFDGSTETVKMIFSNSLSSSITTSRDDDTVVALVAATATPATAPGFTAEGSAPNTGLVEDRVASPNTYAASTTVTGNAYICIGLIAVLAG